MTLSMSVPWISIDITLHYVIFGDSTEMNFHRYPRTIHGYLSNDVKSHLQWVCHGHVMDMNIFRIPLVAK